MRSKMRLWTTLGVALGLSTAHSAYASDGKKLREECTASRCVYYEGSKRVFSVEREKGTSRIVVRDDKRRVRAKVSKKDGTIKIEKPDRRR